jgi:hypothetical protein
MRSFLVSSAALALLILMWSISAADCPADEPAAPTDAMRQRRLELLTSHVDQLQLSIDGRATEALKRGKQPILHWSNPVREYVNDGVTFLYFDGARPQAVVTVWVRSLESSLRQGELWHEFVSLSGQPLTCRRGDRKIWTPKTGGLVDQILEKAPPPAERPAQRLAQMRDAARRFRAENYKMGSPNELRLMTQPLHRYQDEDAGILDGALFAFVEGNDPEVLVLIEAVAGGDGKESRWRYTAARMTSFQLTLRLDDREIFSVGPYYQNPRAPTDPYSEANDGRFTLD